MKPEKIMNRLKTRFAIFFRSQTGVTSMEYALLGALIAIAIIGAVQDLGVNLNAIYQYIADKVGNAIAGVI